MRSRSGRAPGTANALPGADPIRIEEQACDEQRSRVRTRRSDTNRQNKKTDLFGRFFYFGTRGARVEEPLSWAIEYPIEWREPKINLAELAKLRWIEKWTRKAIAAHYGKTECAIQNYFRDIKRLDFVIAGLSESDRRRIKAKAEWHK